MGYSYEAERVEAHLDIQRGDADRCLIIRCAVCGILELFANAEHARHHGMSKTVKNGWVHQDCKQKKQDK